MDQGKTIPEKIFGFAIVDRLSDLSIVVIIETCNGLPVFSYAQNFIQPAVGVIYKLIHNNSCHGSAICLMVVPSFVIKDLSINSNSLITVKYSGPLPNLRE